MNLKNRKAIVVILTAIYCFGLGAFTHSHAARQTPQNSTAEYSITDISANLFCHTAQTESSIHGLNQLQNLNVKQCFFDIWTSYKTTDQLLQTQFVQWNGHAVNLLISQRNTDIIFPFHYFL